MKAKLIIGGLVLFSTAGFAQSETPSEIARSTRQSSEELRVEHINTQNVRHVETSERKNSHLEQSVEPEVETIETQPIRSNHTEKKRAPRTSNNEARRESVNPHN